MPGPLEGKHVVLGVTGSIACYKAIDLASKLTQAGALVDTVMSYGATQFVTPLAFRSITHRAVITDTYDANSQFSIEHVALAHQADVVVIAPATAHCIAKLAQGLADDPLTTTIIATTAPRDGCPGNGRQHVRQPRHPGERGNPQAQRRSVRRSGPRTFGLWVDGNGKVAGDAELLGYISYTLGKDADLKGRKIVVSAGGTMEPIDPVRVITNHSSGKMGYAIAEAARDRGANVVLVAASHRPARPGLGQRREGPDGTAHVRRGLAAGAESGRPDNGGGGSRLPASHRGRPKDKEVGGRVDHRVGQDHRHP